MDQITSNLNEVFTETKQLVQMTSTLKHQLEARTIELNKIKKEKKMLMQEVIQLKDDYERSETRKNELENQIDIMRTELLKAQNSLSRLEQFENEKLKLKEDLETKIDEFNMLSEDYQREKESYLHVLEHVQDQVNVYKDKSEQFDAEKGSWSKQIDELKSELIQTKATIVKMEELEQRNANLALEIQAKDIEIYKIKKESERTLQNQLEQFKTEMKLYQDKIVKYEKDREIWEKQMKQMKAQFAGLETSLEEKENFIKKYITQPLSTVESSEQPISQYLLSHNSHHLYNISPPHNRAHNNLHNHLTGFKECKVTPSHRHVKKTRIKMLHQQWTFSHYETKQLSPLYLQVLPMGVNGIRTNINNKFDTNTYFIIKKDVYEDMIAHCRSALPNEGCGLLSGIASSGETLWKLRNESHNSNRFYMSAQSIKKTVETIEKKCEMLTGIFHSHPNSPAIPSSYDIQYNTYNNLAYIIVSFYKGNIEVGCFRMENKTIIQLELILIDD